MLNTKCKRGYTWQQKYFCYHAYPRLCSFINMSNSICVSSYAHTFGKLASYLLQSTPYVLFTHPEKVPISFIQVFHFTMAHCAFVIYCIFHRSTLILHFLYYTVTSEYSRRITFSRSFGAISI